VLQDNYLGRQIDIMARMLSMFLLKREVSTYFDSVSGETTLEGEASGFVARLEALVADGKIGAAEDALFDLLDEDAPGYVIQSAIVFYMKLNNLKDKALEDGGFSKEEILDGLNEMKALFGIETD